MGLADLFGSVANVYNKIKSGVSEVYNFGKNVVHKARGAYDWVDEHLNKLSTIPFVGEMLQEGIDELRDLEYRGISWNKLKKKIHQVDDWVQAGEIEAVAQQIDYAISSALSAGESYGGKLDQTFSGGAQPMGGLMV